MSNIKIKDINIHYNKAGNNKQEVILLHGWGQNTEMMIHIQNHLSNFFTVYNIDLPGFGESELMPYAYSPDDFVELIHEFVLVNNIKNPILIGHSFGGHISTRYAAKYDVYKMVLTGSAGLKPKRDISYYIRVYTYKLGKKIFNISFLNKYKDKFMKNKGSTDYQNTSGVLRETFVKVVNSYIDNILDKIECEVLLVYGSNDDATPLWMGKYLESHIKNAGLAVFEGCDHYAYYTQANRFNNVLDAFFKEDIC